MKKLLFCLWFICCSVVLLPAQGRLVKSSSKKVPAWVKNEVKEYQLTRVLGSSTLNLETARRNAELQLSTMVLEKTTTYLLRQDIAFELAENSQRGRDQVEQMVRESDYMQQILNSDALSSYWEIRYEKKTDTTYYLYYLLYNFNEFEMKKIALECDFDRSSSRKALEEL